MPRSATPTWFWPFAFDVIAVCIAFKAILLLYPEYRPSWVLVFILGLHLCITLEARIRARRKTTLIVSHLVFLVALLFGIDGYLSQANTFLSEAFLGDSLVEMEPADARTAIFLTKLNISGFTGLLIAITFFFYLVNSQILTATLAVFAINGPEFGLLSILIFLPISAIGMRRWLRTRNAHRQISDRAMPAGRKGQVEAPLDWGWCNLQLEGVLWLARMENGVKPEIGSSVEVVDREGCTLIVRASQNDQTSE